MRLIDADALKENIDVYFADSYSLIDSVHERVDAMPTIEERKTGRWIDEPVYKQTMDGKTWDGYTYCSECGDMKEYGYRSSFCPNCGARMEA